MSYVFDYKKINDLLNDFYKSTGIAVGFYDALSNPIGGSSVLSPFCKKIKANKSACLECEKSNHTGIKLCSEKGATTVYTCHAGLVETVTPVVFDGVVIAYMQTGQFIDKEKVFSNEDKIRSAEKKYGFTTGELVSLYKDLPVVTKEKLSALNNIMNVLIKSLWENGLIKLTRSAFAVKIEKYISDNLENKILLKEICDKFYLSKNAIYRLFSQEFNLTFGEYLIKLRLEKAQKLLKENKDLSIIEVSEKCGFLDVNYFIRLFKNRVGITPLKFKNQS